MNFKNAGRMVIVTVLMVAMSGCAALSNWGEDFKRDWRGASATMTTYNEQSQIIDKVHGSAINIERDDRFDSKDKEGASKEDSSVLLISVGKDTISHVGSTMILNEDGLNDIMTSTNATVEFKNTDRGVPWLNNLIEKNRNMWSGKSKTIMIRSQNGTPLAVYAGSNVEIFKTSVPKSTQFRVDGKLLFVYRADYTVYDTSLLTQK